MAADVMKRDVQNNLDVNHKLDEFYGFYPVFINKFSTWLPVGIAIEYIHIYICKLMGA